ncbi:MAG TPA: hypothetical protein VL633_09715 [Bacteroidota bacterium]|nr:hypothetical protein [Bacteroidota bacterium]
MQSKIHPFPITLLGAVVTLVVAVYCYQFGGSTMLLGTCAVLSILVGLVVGLNWVAYPWQVALIGGIPGVMFLLWRMTAMTDPNEQALNTSLFVFLPTVAIVATYAGALAGRWRAIKRKAAD